MDPIYGVVRNSELGGVSCISGAAAVDGFGALARLFSNAAARAAASFK